MASFDHPIIWLRHAGLHLALVPSLGGGVASWQIDRPSGKLDLFRPWNGVSDDPFSLAAFAMLPWCNRISGGGFTHAGNFHPMAPNRAGEPFPIHGDGWRQPWSLIQIRDDSAVMTLESLRLNGSPHEYQATQTFTLDDSGMTQAIDIVHLGNLPLPYGVGIHPWFLRTPKASLHAAVDGVWLAGADLLPTLHTREFPPTWDLRDGVSVNGALIDNTFTGWPGTAWIEWPEHRLRLDIHTTHTSKGFCHFYRPVDRDTFCFEPTSHPINAFHLPGQPGLKTLQQGERLTFAVQWRPTLEAN